MCANVGDNVSIPLIYAELKDRSVPTDLKQNCIIAAFFSSSNRFGKDT